VFAEIRRQAQFSGAFSTIAKTRWLLSKLSPSLGKRPITAASSLVSVMVFGVATAGTYAVAGRVDGPALLAMVAGGLIGVLAAKPLAPRLATRAALARRLFAIMVILTALYVGWRSLG